MTPAELYTIRDHFIMEKSITDFHASFHIPEKKNRVSPSTHMHSRKNHCGNTRCQAFKLRSEKKCVLCCSDYSERLVASCSHQLQSEKYGSNQSVYIEGIAFDHFTAPTQTETAVPPQARTYCSIFHTPPPPLMIANMILQQLLHTENT